MATIPEAVRPMVQQLLAQVQAMKGQRSGDLEVAYGKTSNYIRRGLGADSPHLAELERIRRQMLAGVLSGDHWAREFEMKRSRLEALLHVVDEELQLAAMVPMSDEERARELIGLLRDQCHADNGNFAVVSREQVQKMLGCTDAQAVGAILFADSRGWVQAHRAFGPGVMSVSLRASGFAAAGAAVPNAELATVNHYGDVVHGNKAEIGGDGKIKQAQKSKTHDGDTKVDTNVRVGLGSKALDWLKGWGGGS